VFSVSPVNKPEQTITKKAQRTRRSTETSGSNQGEKAQLNKTLLNQSWAA